jgi:branched-subunit amino acid permease
MKAIAIRKNFTSLYFLVAAILSIQITRIQKMKGKLLLPWLPELINIL